MSSSEPQSPSTTTSSAPTSTSAISGDTNPNLSSSAALYLYTFLATLVLLLTVSAAIVIRSYVLRRRQRVLLEEAIRNGTLSPDFGTPRSRGNKVDIGNKPEIYDVYLVPCGDMKGASEKGEWWDELSPVAAQYIHTSHLQSHSSDSPSMSHAERPSFLTRFRRNLFRPFGHTPFRSRSSEAMIPLSSVQQRSPQAPSSPSPNAGATSSPSPPLHPSPLSTSSDTAHEAQSKGQPPSSTHKGDDEEKMNVTFIIAMPSPSSSPSLYPKQSSEDEPLPHVEIGIARVGVGRDAVAGAIESTGTGSSVGNGIATRSV
ncbi:hypothetical protein K474DRAFT_1699516 [Panus rudis PR-1116 ss-1]|nr:hypothetical protein K474DRAFT_1699516 [Panus rudis PR-1116 ss-1]